MAMTTCRFFSGYKPCDKNANCDSQCTHYSVGSPRILVVHLDALGAVLRATSILPAIHRKYPKAHVTWVTRAPSDQFFLNHPLVDRVLKLDVHSLLVLKALEFDMAFVIDKSIEATGILKSTRAKELRGFVSDAQTGAILPANPEADELWQIGLSNKKKFFENQKPETQLLIEALNLGPFQRDPYSVFLTQTEQDLQNRRAREWRDQSEFIIGLNTGCSGVIPYKRWTVEYHRRLIVKLLERFNCRIVLLGGPEDEIRNQQISYGLDVTSSPTNRGLRDGLISVGACDVVVSGDSLGMHMGIALQKFVVAWFGPTCAQEIDLYDRGVRLRSPVGCSPCWKRSCDKPVMCYDQIELSSVLEAVELGRQSLKKSNPMSTQEPGHQLVEI